MAKLVFGCGYLGLRVARSWHELGETVYTVTRGNQRARQLQAEGFVPIVADVTDPPSLRDFPETDGVLYAIGYDRSAGHSMRTVYVDGLRAALDVVSIATRRFLYVSSTGVYGQTDGRWVDETSECRPTRVGGQLCLEAEQILQAHELGKRSVILRMAGIYGPGRIPRQDELRGNRPIEAAQQGFLNLIHVDDAAGVVLAAERIDAVPNLYVVSDGHPVSRGEYCRHVARLANVSPARFTSPPSDSPQGQRARSNKRARNTRMLHELDVTLAYPSYREGLAAAMGHAGQVR